MIKKLIQIILIIIGAILLINLLMIWQAFNFNLGLVLQLIVSIAIIFYAILINKIPKVVHIIMSIISLIIIAFVIFLAVYGNKNNATGKEDYVIVLGAAIHGEAVSMPLAYRLDEAVLFWNKAQHAKIIVCGGQGYQENITEALAMERYLVKKGIPTKYIIKEEKSTSTYENFLFAKRFMKTGSTCVLITNDFHVYRATHIARLAGVSATHIGAKTNSNAWAMSYLREMLAVLKFWIIPSKAVSS